ncbi:threonine/serine dehydratase [Microterricola pindariensis]|uniref:Threonine dehydratase n=1 Tax=Microterricola pindariensis TaxID=478010 RepID=A0ABX5AU04_9MICO|nr:threonine/serine dehydratase [Microterricola pindariensis]PPL17208.1 threonine dehydratase [Microterricola pindariensis]
MTLTRLDVQAAEARTRDSVRRTPTFRASPTLSFKLEFLQHTGTFKARGAFNRQLAARERGELDAGIGIVVASGGNAGIAHAYAASVLGVPSTVFVPETAPAVKVALLRALGATVVQAGSEYVEAYAAATVFAAERGALFCHAYDQPEIAAGAGVLATELLEDDPGIDTIVVAVGGAGLLAGVLAAVDGRAHVVAVEPEAAPTLHAALAAGALVDVPVGGVAADSLGARRVGQIGFELAQPAHARGSLSSVLVADSDIVAARSALWRDYRIPSEHGAAAAAAALASDAYSPRPGERVAVVVCGANTDAGTF